MSYTGRKVTKQRQKGWFMISASMALIIMSIIMLTVYREKHTEFETAAAKSQAGTIGAIRTAAEILVFDHYVDYQEGKPIIRNNITLPWGEGSGESLHPTIDQLSKMNLGIDGISSSGNYKSMTYGGYSITIKRSPAGCELSPSGVDCNITGLVCTDKPVRDDAAHTDVDAPGIGTMLAKLGNLGGISLLGSPGEIIGNGGSWTEPNPIPGTPPGIVCARFGYGVAEYWNFLRVRDSRDPQFMNNVTMKGGVHVRSTANYGEVCPTNGMAVWGNFENKPVWLQCVNGKWEPGNGIAYATEGGACTEDADFGMTTNNVALVCSKNKWVSQAQSGLRSASYYQHGSTVPTPACRAGLTPSAVISTVAASNIIGTNNAGNNTGSFQASIDASWLVRIIGSDGAPAGNNAQALILTFCNP